MAGKRDTGPGPGAYTLPPTIGYKGHDKSRWQNPAYKMGIRIKRGKRDSGPGPNYDTRGYTRFGHVTVQSVKVNSRVVKKLDSGGPGPNAYNVENYKPKNIGFKFGSRVMKDKTSTGPGPAAYNLSNQYPPGPAISMGGVNKKTHKDDSPGPAAYDTSKADALRRRLPTVKFTGRKSEKLDKGIPGPYKYDYLPGKKSPAFSFGVRRNETPYIVPEDNACLVDYPNNVKAVAVR